MASTTKGRSLRVLRKAARNDVTWSINADDRRSSSVRVKKNVPPGTKLRRYPGSQLAAYPGFRFAASGLRAAFKVRLVARMERRAIRVNLRAHRPAASKSRRYPGSQLAAYPGFRFAPSGLRAA